MGVSLFDQDMPYVFVLLSYFWLEIQIILDGAYDETFTTSFKSRLYVVNLCTMYIFHCGD